MKEKVDFQIRDLKGETSEENFEGLFVLKTKLSIREQLREDEVRRSILGGMPDGASEFAVRLADALAYVAVRLEKGPDWWVKKNGGLDLEDLNVIVEVHKRAVEAISAEYKARIEEAKKAQPELAAALNNG